MDSQKQQPKVSAQQTVRLEVEQPSSSMLRVEFTIDVEALLFKLFNL